MPVESWERLEKALGAISGRCRAALNDRPFNGSVVGVPERSKFVNRDGREFENLVAPGKLDA